jgi:hypothetical protein
MRRSIHGVLVMSSSLLMLPSPGHKIEAPCQRDGLLHLVPPECDLDRFALDHLIALKLHAMKQKLPHRTSKDAEDVELLVRRNNINLTKPEYKALFLKFGTLEIYETFRILKH